MEVAKLIERNEESTLFKFHWVGTPETLGRFAQ